MSKKIVSMRKTKVNPETGKVEDVIYGDEHGMVSNQFADNLIHSNTNLSGMEVVTIEDIKPNNNDRSY